jgi:DNA-binding transcriptional regulator YiaG
MGMGPVRAACPPFAENDVPADPGYIQDSGALTRNRNAVSLRGMSEQSYLSEAIRAARRRAGLSQAELAAALGVRQSSVSQWERGSTRPSTDHLLALTSILRTTLLDFSTPASGSGGAEGGGEAAARAVSGSGGAEGGGGGAGGDGHAPASSAGAAGAEAGAERADGEARAAGAGAAAGGGEPGAVGVGTWGLR